MNVQLRCVALPAIALYKALATPCTSVGRLLLEVSASVALVFSAEGGRFSRTVSEFMYNGFSRQVKSSDPCTFDMSQRLLTEVTQRGSNAAKTQHLCIAVTFATTSACLAVCNLAATHQLATITLHLATGQLHIVWMPEPRTQTKAV